MIASPGRQRQHYQETDIYLCLNKFLFKPTIPIYLYIYIYPNQTTGREAGGGGGGDMGEGGGGERGRRLSEIF